MPCRMDDMPVTVNVRLREENEKLKKMGNKLQADLCKLGEYMSDILAGRKTLEEVREDPVIIKLMGEHLKHRRKDRDRYIDTLTKRIKTAKMQGTREVAISLLSEAASMSDEDLLTTDRF